MPIYRAYGDGARLDSVWRVVQPPVRGVSGGRRMCAVGRSIRRRRTGRADLTLIGFVGAVLVVGLLAHISVNVIQGLVRDEQSIARSYHAVADIDELQFALSQAESGHRAFVSSGNEEFLTAYERALSRMPDQLEAVRQGLRPADPARIAELVRGLGATLAPMRRAVELRRTKGERAAREYMAAGESRRLTASLIDLLESLDREEVQRAQALEARREESVRRIWSATALLLAGLGALLALLYRSVRRSERQAAAALDSLREGEARFRSLTDLSADWYWEQDAQLRFTFLSSEVETKSGYPAATRVGLTRWGLPGVDLDSADWAAHEAICRAHQPFRQFVYRRVHENGSVRWNSISGEPLFDARGQFKGYRGVTSDITHQKRTEQEIIRRKDLHAALSQTNRAIIHIHQAQALFEEVCRVAIEHGHLSLAWIGLLDEATGWVEPKAVHGPARGQYMRRRVSIDPDRAEGGGFSGAALREGRHYVVNDLFSEPRAAPWVAEARAAGVRSMATFPLMRDGRSVGLLNVYGDEVGFFADDLVALLEEMAQNISFALANMQREAEREAVQHALRESEQKFRLLASNLPEVFWTAQPRCKQPNYVSPAYQTIFGRSVQSLLQNPAAWMDAVHPADREAVATALRAARNGRLDHELRIVRSDGAVRWIHNRSFPVLADNGAVTLITGIAEDITERKASHELLQYMAHYDELTDLPNRNLFHDRLRQSLAQARSANRTAAVALVDLDHFKRINDTLGHAAGDRLLQEVARRLRAGLRPGDTVARLSSDEFALVLCELAGSNDAVAATRALMEAVAEPIELDGHELFVTASVGVTLSPGDSEDPATLLGNADTAMHRAKKLGRNTYQFFQADMNAHAMERLSMENQLRRALERNEFVLHYQPKVDLASGQITGLEALLRWMHPEQGLVPPARFIPILEDNGMIVPVGEWVLAEACRQIKLWGEAGLPSVPVAVNLSVRQMQHKDLDRSVKRIVSGSGVDPRLVELELTESMLMRNADEAGKILRALKQFGIRLSVDDFGTGYSSLAYLKSFPLDALKIDRSFVREITSNPDDAMITRAVISLAHSLRLKVVAEGVETAAQLALLVAYGCDEMQGFYFSRPLAADACASFMRQTPPLSMVVRGRGERTLLLVDDEPSILSLLSRLLSRDGYRILTAGGAAEAFELLAMNQVDVVISDQRMPGTTGVELLRCVKGLYPDSVRIVMSGHADVQTVTEAINQGAVYKFCTKPWDNDQLRSDVKEAFAYKVLQDENRRLTERVRSLETDVLEAGAELA